MRLSEVVGNPSFRIPERAVLRAKSYWRNHATRLPVIAAGAVEGKNALCAYWEMTVELECKTPSSGSFSAEPNTDET